MPITVSWDDDQKTITRVAFDGNFTFDDIMDAWQAELELVRSVQHPVYSLNLFGVVPFTVQGLDVRRMREFAQNVQADNLQMTVQVAEHRLIRSMLQMMPLYLPNERHVVASEAEAYALIEQHKAG
jgi:hypothetical protein